LNDDEEDGESEEEDGSEDDYDVSGDGIAPHDMEMADGSINLFSMPGERIGAGGTEDDQGDEGGGAGEEDLFGEADEDEDMAMDDAGDLDLTSLTTAAAGHTMPNGIGVGEKRRADDDDDDDYDA